MSNKPMKKLDEIPKKNAFEVPDGYFDRLPGIIQSRISDASPSPVGAPSWVRSLRYALPVLFLLGAGIFWYQSSSTNSLPDVRSELASIQSDQLAAYLDDHEVSTEDLVETVRWTSDDLDDLENTVYSDYGAPPHQLEEILNEYDEL
jgi:hypothetical protein